MIQSTVCIKCPRQTAQTMIEHLQCHTQAHWTAPTHKAQWVYLVASDSTRWMTLTPFCHKKISHLAIMCMLTMTTNCNTQTVVYGKCIKNLNRLSTQFLMKRSLVKKKQMEKWALQLLWMTAIYIWPAQHLV